MERILADIQNETLQNSEIHQLSSLLLDVLTTTDPSSTLHQFYCDLNNLKQVLKLFELGVKNEVVRLNSSSIDLMRIYVRKINDYSNLDQEEIINLILKCCREVFGQMSVATTLEMLAFIIEIAATFSASLTIKHVIDIVELCHVEIKEYMLRHSHQSTTTRGSLLNFAGLASRISIEDKMLSAIYLTAGQVCHYFTKHKVSGSLGSISEDNIKMSQDFVHLLLYLGKKLETKVSFYQDINWSQNETKTSRLYLGSSSSGEETKSEIFLLIKVYNCFYLKCLHYILLTIPDAWRFMTNRLMEVIWRNLAPVLVNILNPTSTIAPSSGLASCIPKGTKVKCSDSGTGFFGRGSERLHLTPGAALKSSSLNSFSYHERQYIYKISLELLRLFGLESSMRPLLEALYHRIFLLPSLDQRLDSLIYLQEIFRNPLLVLVLMSNPICLFGPSSSHSEYLDLFQIFMDAIKEACLAEDPLLNQLSLACMATLFSTIFSLCNGTLSETKKHFKQGVFKSPTVKIIFNYVEKNEKLYESCYGGTRHMNRHSSSHWSRLSKYSSRVNRFSFLNIKDRICGYDSSTFETKLNMDRIQTIKEKERSGEESDEHKSRYLQEDFDYRDKLKALVSESVEHFSSIESNNSDRSLTVEVEKRQTALMRTRGKNSLGKSSKCVHLSLENLHTEETWSDFAQLKYTSSDSRLQHHQSIVGLGTLDAISLLDYGDPDSSVFDITTERASDSETDSLDNDEDNGDEEVDCRFDSTTNFMPRRIVYSLDDEQLASLGYFERALARILVRKLKHILPELSSCRNVFQVDEFIQNFASSFCQDLYINLKLLKHGKLEQINRNKLIDLTKEEIEVLCKYTHLFPNLFINADGIYLTTYLTLLLNLKLIYFNYYREGDRTKIPLSEKNFIEDVLSYHITIYLSPYFLAEIYQSVLAENFLQVFGDESTFDRISLIRFLHDIDVLDLSNPNAFKLSQYARLEQVAHSNDGVPSLVRPLQLLIKRFLAYFWDTFLLCFRHNLDKKYTFASLVQVVESFNSAYINSICSVLDCENKSMLSQCNNWNVNVQVAQMLFENCLQVGYYSRLDTIYDLVFRHLGKYTSQDKSLDLKNLKLKRSVSSNEVSSLDRMNLVLSVRHVLAVKSLLTNSSRVGTYCPRIWKNVFNLCKFVTDLEALIFRSARSSLLSRARISISTILKSNSMVINPTPPESGTVIQSDHYQSLYDFGAFTAFPGINEAEYKSQEINFKILMNEIKRKTHEVELKSKELEQIVEHMTLFAAQIFENVALKCNLSLLNNFVLELCEFSKTQLSQLAKQKEEKSGNVSSEWSSFELKSLMLFRLVEVILRFVRNGRPLLHFMKVWPTISAHLVHASTHREQVISKKAITSLHDIINAFLTSYNELDFFNFNESLFKSYEKLLLFELCNSESQQELLLYSICEFVEGASKEIRSGWKSIFRALSGLRLAIREPSSGGTGGLNCSHHIQILTDTFEAFLRTDNMHVLAYASVDFVPCVVHLIKNFSIDSPKDTDHLNDVFIIFLKYLQKFSKILRSINDLPEDSFVVAFYIRPKQSKLIDLDCLRTSLATTESNIGFNLDLVDCVSLVELDKPLTILQIWCTFFEEFASAICSSLIRLRPMLLEVYFTMIQTVHDMNDSLEFLVYCFNHINLPMMQNMLRETLDSDKQLQLDEIYMFLKSWLQVFNNYIIKFILEYYKEHSTDTVDEEKRFQSIGLLFKQALLINVECLNGQYHDLISILALSSIRHLLVSLHGILGGYFWGIVIDCFKVAHQLTIFPLRHLTGSFTNLPAVFTNDLARIKILTTRATDQSNDYIRKRASQIFVANSEQIKKLFETKSTRNVGAASHDNRVFTIIVETSSGVQKSLSYNTFITQLHNHLTLLQTMSSVLLFNVKPSLTKLIMTMYVDFGEIFYDQVSSEVVPMLHLNLTQFRDICYLYKQTYHYAMEFDSRPGLKFLIGYICQLNVTPNLCQLSSLAWLVQVVMNHFLCTNNDQINEDSLCALEELFSEIALVYNHKNAVLHKLCTETEISTDDNLPSLDQPLKVAVTSGTLDPESDCKAFQLASSDKVNQLLQDYRKMKIKQNMEARRASVPLEGDSPVISNDGTCKDFLKTDLNGFVRFWSDILAKCIALHGESSQCSFRFLMPAYQHLARPLVLHASDLQLRQALVVWLDQLAKQIQSQHSNPFNKI